MLSSASNLELKGLLVLFLLFASPLVSLWTHPVGAVSGTLLAVDTVPETPGIDNTTTVLTSFIVTVAVVNVTNLFGWQFTLSYNTSLLTAQYISPGPSWKSPDAFVGQRIVDDATGTVTLAVTLIGANTLGLTTSGVDTLAEVFFITGSTGISILHLSDEILLNNSIETIPHTTMDGCVTVGEVSGSTGSCPPSGGGGNGGGDGNLAPVARFYFTPNPPLRDETITFDASPSFDYDGSIKTYAWDFDEDGVFDLSGNSTTASVVTWSFSGLDVHVVVLQVTDNLAAVGRTLNIVRVNTAPVAGFTFSPLFPFAGETITFDASSTVDRELNVVSYVWDFGDRTPLISLSGPTVNHTYEEGTYTVTVNVTDSRGLSGLTQQSLSVGPMPRPDFALIASPSWVGVLPTGPETFVVNVTSLFGFVGSVDLTLSISPVVTYGPTAYLNPTTLVLDSAGNAISTLTVSTTNATSLGTYTIAVNAASGNLVHSAIVYVVARPLGESTRRQLFTRPFAIFEFSPTSPLTEEPVTFDASNSYSLRGYIREWYWSFGDGSSGIGTVATHAYLRVRNYTVTLTVTDNQGWTASESVEVRVRDRPFHDVSVDGISVEPKVAVSSQTVKVEVVLTNRGLSAEIVDFVIYYDSRVAASLRSVTIDPRPMGRSLLLEWNTLGVPPGNYTLSAEVFLAADENPDDNTIGGSRIEIRPPPMLDVVPNTGVPGARVVLIGEGFPPTRFGPLSSAESASSISIIVITFDDSIVGYTVAKNGVFDFRFKIPDVIPGIYQLEAADLFTDAHATVSFTVLPGPVNVH